MFTIKTTKPTALAIFSAIAIGCTSAVALAQAAPETDDQATQMARFGGAMHATATICGGYSEKELAELKEQQQETLAQQGMDEDSFEQAYSAGVAEAGARWEALSEAEQKKTCDEVRQQSNEMTR